jgi:hypothetical protein
VGLFLDHSPPAASIKLDRFFILSPHMTLSQRASCLVTDIEFPVYVIKGVAKASIEKLSQYSLLIRKSGSKSKDKQIYFARI